MRAVAGSVTSKSCATSVPATVGAETFPPAEPLNVALPYTRNGKWAGPCRASTRGRHSSRFEVETEKRRLEDDEIVPDACTRDPGVERLNCSSSNSSPDPR